VPPIHLPLLREVEERVGERRLLFRWGFKGRVRERGNLLSPALSSTSLWRRGRYPSCIKTGMRGDQADGGRA